MQFNSIQFNSIQFNSIQAWFGGGKAVADDFKAIRQNSDVLALFPGVERDERNLLASISSGERFRELQTLLQHSMLGARTGYSQDHSFKVGKPFLLLITNPETSKFLRVRESINNLSKNDATRVPPAVLNLKRPREEIRGEEEEEEEEEELEEG